MTGKTKMYALAVLMLAMAGLTAGAQAYAVGADGKLAQEKQAPTVAPEDQASVEQLTRLFEVMRIKEQVQAMRQMVPSMFEQQVQSALKQTEAGLPAGTHLTAAQRRQMGEVMSKYVTKSMDLYPSDEMLSDMTGVYQRHLSKQDVDGLIVFYGTPAGQHLLDAQPAIAKEFTPVVMSKVAERGQAMSKQMMVEIEAIVPAAKAAGAKPAAKPQAKPATKPSGGPAAK